MFTENVYAAFGPLSEPLIYNLSINENGITVAKCWATRCGHAQTVVSDTWMSQRCDALLNFVLPLMECKEYRFYPVQMQENSHLQVLLPLLLKDISLVSFHKKRGPSPKCIALRHCIEALSQVHCIEAIDAPFPFPLSMSQRDTSLDFWWLNRLP